MNKVSKSTDNKARKMGQILEKGVRKGVTRSLSLNKVLKSTQWKRRGRGLKSEQSKGGLLPVQ